MMMTKMMLLLTCCCWRFHIPLVAVAAGIDQDAADFVDNDDVVDDTMMMMKKAWQSELHNPYWRQHDSDMELDPWRWDLD